MFDIGASELLLVIIVAVLVIGPKDMPRALRTVGKWVGKARAMSRHFQTGLDAMIREAELEEMQQKWDAENARIMAQSQTPSQTHGQAMPNLAKADDRPDLAKPAPDAEAP